MKRFITATIFLFSALYCHPQKIDWQKTTKWKLYNIISDSGFNYSLDTLQKFPFILLNDDSIHLFMRRVDAWPDTEFATWMGAWFASCEAGGKIRKVIISVYGGFFYDQAAKKYFELPLEIRNRWMEFLNASMAKMADN